MIQAAMYVRVSTRQQKEGETIESQKALLIHYANQKGFEIIPELTFEDDGYSGGKLARPALDRLRDLASEGVFEDVFILSPDRLSRKLAYQVILMDEFKAYGTKVHFQNTKDPVTPTDHLLLQMQGAFAEYERAQIAERSRRGKMHKAKNGRVSIMSGASYGYRYIKGIEGVQSYFEVNENEAIVVKSIFDLYVKKRLTMTQIKNHLLEKQIRSPTGKSDWSVSTISRILKNSAYRGIAYYGKSESCEPTSTRLPGRSIRLKGRRTPKRGVRLRNSEEWIAIPVPAIIDNETFKIAQEITNANKKLSLRNAKPGSLLQGLISCAECGYSFGLKSSGKKAANYRYYKCSGPCKKCTNRRGMRVEPIDEAIWKSVISMLKSPELIKGEVSRRLTELDKAPILQKAKSLDDKLEKLETDSNRLLDAYQSGCIELVELKIRMNKIKQEKKAILHEKVGMDTGLSKKQLLGLSEAISCFNEHLEASQGNLTLEGKRKIIRLLIQEIKVAKDGIIIDHIIPVGENLADQIAHLRSASQRCIENNSIF
jgi:site-specific DNA recombinase